MQGFLSLYFQGTSVINNVIADNERLFIIKLMLKEGRTHTGWVDIVKNNP